MSYFFRLDLHGQTLDSARKLLDATLKALPADVREVEVIHGYHQGTALRTLVRNYKHPKIQQKILGLNQGSTVFLIRKD